MAWYGEIPVGVYVGCITRLGLDITKRINEIMRQKSCTLEMYNPTQVGLLGGYA
jgi:hypothetical protein